MNMVLLQQHHWWMKRLSQYRYVKLTVGKLSRCQWVLFFLLFPEKRAGPSCSKLTMSLVNDSLKFTSRYANMLKFFADKMWVAFAVQKLLTFFQQKISEYCILNLLKQLTKWPLTSSLSWRRFEQLGPGEFISSRQYSKIIFFLSFYQWE